MNRRVFNESLVASLNLPAGEKEELLARARTEGAAFAKTLVSRGLLSAVSLRHAYETLCGIPPFRGAAAGGRGRPRGGRLREAARSRGPPRGRVASSCLRTPVRLPAVPGGSRGGPAG